MNPVAQLLNQIIIGKRLVAAVADEAAVSDSTVYASCDGRNNPNLEIIKAAFVVTGDPRLKKLLSPRGFRLIPDDQQLNPQKDLESEAVDVSLKNAEAITEIRDRLADGVVDDEDKNAIEQKFQAVEREIAEARAKLAALKKAGKPAQCGRC